MSTDPKDLKPAESVTPIPAETVQSPPPAAVPAAAPDSPAPEAGLPPASTGADGAAQPSTGTTGFFTDGGVARGAQYAPPSDTALHRIAGALGKSDPTWWARPAGYVALAIFGGLLLWLLRPVLTPIAAAFAAAYFVSPVVDRLEKRGVSRTASIIGILVLAFGGVAAVIAVLIPLIQGELTSLVDSVPVYLEKGSDWFNASLRPWLEQRLERELPNTQQEFWDEVGDRVSNMSPDLAGKLTDIATNTVSNVFGLLGAVLSAVLFPVFFFYILKDFPQIKEAIKEMIPPRNRDLVLGRLAEVDRVIAAFVRGQITVCVFLAIAYSIGLSFTGIDLPVVIGVLSGFAFIVPYAGTIIGIVAGSAMAIAKFGVIDPDFVLWIEPHLLGVWAVFGIVQAFESNVITPKIVGEQVGLHPVVMITAVIVGGQLFGFLGVFLAVPATAAAGVFWWAAWDRYRRSDFYRARR